MAGVKGCESLADPNCFKGVHAGGGANIEGASESSEYAKGGPVIKAKYKSTGAVDPESFVAPMKSRGYARGGSVAKNDSGLEEGRRRSRLLGEDVDPEVGIQGMEEQGINQVDPKYK